MTQKSELGLGRLRHNTIALTGLQVANVLLPLLTLPYLLRVLGPSQFGAYSLAQSVMLYGTVLADYGFNLSATQRIAQASGDSKEVSRVFWAVQLAKTGLALVALAGLALATMTVPQFREIWPVMLAGTPVIVGAVLFPQWLFQGLERMLPITLCSILARMTTIPLIFLFVSDQQDAHVALFIVSSGAVLSGVFASLFIWRARLIHWRRPRVPEARAMLRDGSSIFISTASISLYTTITPLLLGILTHTGAVGIYSAADRIRLACQSLLTPLSQAAYPRVSAVMSSSVASGLHLVRQLLIVQGALTLTVSVLLWLFAPLIVRLVMGNDYEASISVLRMLAPILFVVGLSNVFGIQTMLPMGLKIAFSRIVLASGMINIALLGVLASRYEALGAAASMLATEILVAVAMLGTLQWVGINIFKATCNSGRSA